MNAYAALAIGSTLLIPTALLYRVLNPVPPTPKPYRRVVGGLQMCDIRHVQEAWAGKPQEELLAHYDREAELDRIQLAEEAKTAAEAARVAVVKQAEQAAWDASLLGRSINKAANVGVAIGVTLMLAPFVILLLAIPAFLIFGILGLVAFKFIALGLLIAWCLNDFKNDIADEAIARQKSLNQPDPK